MNNSLHIAGREYAENARTKGFWVNLLMFPVILFLSIKVPQLLEEKAKPARHFVMVDQTGEFDAVVDRAVERRYQRAVFSKLIEYQKKYAKPAEDKDDGASDQEFSADMLEQMPAGILGSNPTDPVGGMLEAMEEQSPEMFDLLSEEGGLDLVLQMFYTTLIDNPPTFEPPRRMLVRDGVPDGALDGLDVATADPADIVKAIKPYLLNEKSLATSDDPLFALVVVPADAFSWINKPGEMPKGGGGLETTQEGVQFWSSNLTDTDLSELIERSINREVQHREFVAKSMDPETISQVQRTEMQFVSFDPKKAEGEEVVSVADTIRKWAPVGFVYLLWVAIFTVVNMLLNNTVEEKSNRIIEVLLSSATPWEIMSGKLIGIAGVGLTMMVGWILSLLGVLKFMAGPEVEWAGVLFEVIQNSGLLPLFGLYFLCGYLTYAGIFLAIGSLCNTVKEAQNFMGTATIILMVPLFTMVFIAQDPHGMLATFLTWVPLYTPFVMMNRAAADPPMFDLVGTGIVMFFTVIFMLWLSSRIFRMGVL
ncbi:MAG: ABC transporter permease, partial [Planctomycetota bacterium]